MESQGAHPRKKVSGLMYLLLLALLLGMAIGYSGRVEGRLAIALDRVTSVVLFAILAIMGAKLASPETMAALSDIGFRAFVFAVATVTGSILAVGLAVSALSALHRQLGREAGRR